MTEATTVNVKGNSKVPSIEYRQVSFDADAYTYASGLPVKSFMWSIVSATGTDAQFIQLSESNGTFTINIDTEGSGTQATNVVVNLWIITKE